DAVPPGWLRGGAHRGRLRRARPGDARSRLSARAHPGHDVLLDAEVLRAAAQPLVVVGHPDRDHLRADPLLVLHLLLVGRVGEPAVSEVAMTSTSTAPRTDRAAGTGEPVLSVRDLRVEYHTDAGAVRAVNGVSFDLM